MARCKARGAQRPRHIRSIGEEASTAQRRRWPTAVVFQRPVKALPLDVRVIIIGEPLLYYLLSEYAPELPALFKINTDFAEDVERTPKNSALYAT